MLRFSHILEVYMTRHARGKEIPQEIAKVENDSLVHAQPPVEISGTEVKDPALVGGRGGDYKTDHS
jgi:hypothetical protein